MQEAECFSGQDRFHDGGGVMKVYNAVTRFVLTVTAVLVFLATGGCTTTTINHSYGINQSFAGLKNYNWGSPSALVLSRQDTVVDQNVQYIADQELKLKGFNKSSEKPDFEISIVYDYNNEIPYSYQLRMLTMNVYRIKNKELIWRGTASRAINIDVSSGELKKAVKDILAKFPAFSEAVSKDAQLSDLGFQYLQRGDYAQAEKYLDQALSENPNNPYAILNLGAVYQNTGRAEKARKTYEKLITLNPSDVSGALQAVK